MKTTEEIIETLYKGVEPDYTDILEKIISLVEKTNSQYRELIALLKERLAVDDPIEIKTEAVGLLQELIQKDIKRMCVGKCGELIYNPHPATECLVKRLEHFLDELEQ